MHPEPSIWPPAASEPPPPLGYPPSTPGFSPHPTYPPPGYGQGYGYGYGYPVPPMYAYQTRPPRPGPAPGYEYAGVGIRTAAHLVDSLLMVVIGFLLLLVVGGAAVGFGIQDSDQTGTAVIGATFLLGWPLLSTLYLVSLWATTGRTLGMMAFHLRVGRLRDGRPLGWGHAMLRALGFVVACVPLGAGLFAAGWDARRQGWHDRIAGTLVVRELV